MKKVDYSFSMKMHKMIHTIMYVNEIREKKREKTTDEKYNLFFQHILINGEGIASIRRG